MTENEAAAFAVELRTHPLYGAPTPELLGTPVFSSRAHGFLPILYPPRSAISFPPGFPPCWAGGIVRLGDRGSGHAAVAAIPRRATK
jgi:hypothetical protein